MISSGGSIHAVVAGAMAEEGTEASAFVEKPLLETNPTVKGLLTLTGGQIKFPATAVPSADPNTMDDYEEGSWTPVDGSGAALDFTGAVGRYVKIGKQITCWGVLTYPTTADGSAANVGGLPATTENLTTTQSGGIVTATTCATLVYYYLSSNGSQGALLTNVGDAVLNSAMSGKLLNIMAIYRIA